MVSDRDNSDAQAPQAAYDIALWQLTEQVNENRSFDTRAGVVVTVAAAFAGLFGAAIVSTSTGDIKSATGLAAACGGIAVPVAFGSTICLLPDRQAQPLVRGPDPRDLIGRAASHDELPVRLWIAEALVESVLMNEVAARDKARWFRRELFGAMALGLVTVVAILAITFVRAQAA